jgi:hypothetical protein
MKIKSIGGTHNEFSINDVIEHAKYFISPPAAELSSPSWNPNPVSIQHIDWCSEETKLVREFLRETDMKFLEKPAKYFEFPFDKIQDAKFIAAIWFDIYTRFSKCDRPEEYIGIQNQPLKSRRFWPK